MRVLLIEDDAMLADGLKRSLEQADYTVDWTADGEEAGEILAMQEFDLVILDLTLPGLDGLDILRALLRRSHAGGLQTLSCGDLVLDIAARRVHLNGTLLELPRREFHILEVLMARQGRILSKETITELISHMDEELNPSAVEIYISRLRKKLKNTTAHIRTVRGLGYLLECG